MKSPEPTVRFARRFLKDVERLPPKRRAAVTDAISLWLSDPDSPKLRRHALKGPWQDHPSINAGGDLRIIFRSADDGVFEFVAAGTHSQLYR